MGKKSKKKLQKLINKKQHLQQAFQDQKQASTFQPSSSVSSEVDVGRVNQQTPQVQTAQAEDSEAVLMVPFHWQDIVRTLVSVGIIIICMVAIIITNKSYHYLTPISDKIYQFLKLNA